jgi:hypothetical protein
MCATEKFELYNDLIVINYTTQNTIHNPARTKPKPAPGAENPKAPFR